MFAPAQQAEALDRRAEAPPALAGVAHGSNTGQGSGFPPTIDHGCTAYGVADR